MRSALARAGFGAFEKAFEDDGWDDVAAFPEITSADLVAMGFKAGHQNKFRKAFPAVVPDTAAADKAAADKAAADKAAADEAQKEADHDAKVRAAEVAEAARAADAEAARQAEAAEAERAAENAKAQSVLAEYQMSSVAATDEDG